jgi:hypothetical protein
MIFVRSTTVGVAGVDDSGFTAATNCVSVLFRAADADVVVHTIDSTTHVYFPMPVPDFEAA